VTYCSVPSRHYYRRRGIVTLWVILFAPLFVLLLCAVADIGRIWLARVELENAAEAAALAAVQEWGDGGLVETLPARQAGQRLAGANRVDGATVTVDLNHAPAGPNNENAGCEGLIFGALSSTSPTVVFDATLAPDCGSGRPGAVQIRVSAPVQSICNNYLGIALGPFRVSAEATAFYECTIMQPRLAHVDSSVCP